MLAVEAEECAEAMLGRHRVLHQPAPCSIAPNRSPDTFEQPVAVTIEQGAITYLQEQQLNVGKLVIATQTKSTDQDWPAIISQHGWTAEGGLSVRTATGMCRMRALK